MDVSTTSETLPYLSNPYIVGNPVEGATLYGREEVFSFVYETLSSVRQNAVVLHGQRRAGKTSILRDLPNHLPAEKFHTTYFDLQGQAHLDLTEVLYNLAGAIAKSLDLPLPNYAELKNNKAHFQKSFLPRIWYELGKRRLLLLFDEFDVHSEIQDRIVREKAEQEFYPYMRELLDTEKRLAFIFVVGRRIDDLTHWVKRVFKEAQYRKVGLLKRVEAIDLIQKPAENVGLTYQPETIEAILELTSGHPFFTQLICFEVFSYAQKHKLDTISPAEVAAIVEPALESGELQFAWLWDAISSSGRIYLAAVTHIRAEKKQATENSIPEMLERFSIRPGPGWNSVFRELTDWDVLQDDPNNIQFIVKLVELWIRQKHTLQDLKAELMREGESEFKTARGLAQQGQFNQAVKALQDLLTTNPNHLGAQLTLAQTLLEQKKYKEAVDAFEDAFWMDENVGRDGLIDARLALAQTLEEKKQFVEAAVQYRRVLELKPDEYRVQEKLRILYDQGRKAYAAGDWEKATHSFERVTDVDRGYKDAGDRRDQAFSQLKNAAQTEANRETPKARPPAPSRSRKSLAPIIGIVVIVLAVVGGISAWLTWGGASTQVTSTPTQAIVLIDETPSSEPAIERTHEPTAESTTEPTANPTTEPTVEPTTGPTQEPTEELTPEPTREAAQTPISEPTQTPTEEPTSTDTPTPIIIVVTPTSTPTPTLPSYPQPQLISPPNLDLNTAAGIFFGRANQPRLEWKSGEKLGKNDFYVVTVSFLTASGRTFEGASVKNNFWDVNQRFYDIVAGPERDFTWSVVVAHFEGSTVNSQGFPEPVGEGIEVSPRSETRVFRWN